MKHIGVSQRVIFQEKGSHRDALEQDYVRYYNALGGCLHPIPNVLADLRRYLSEHEWHGFFLSGGNDIHPNRYGGTVETNSDYSIDRDQTEETILDYALDHDLPVFCECRGAEFLNVYLGGTLRQVPNHVIPSHPIQLTDAKQFFKVKNINVNSFHRFGFTARELSPKLRAFAVAADSVIEGVYYPEKPIAGILWHPERSSPSSARFDRKLFTAFLEEKGFWK